MPELATESTESQLPRAGGQRPSELWAAWQRIGLLEEKVQERCGNDIAADLLALWAIARFGDRVSGEDGVLQELVDEQMHPRFGDWLLEDVARFAFALGAGWDESQARDLPKGHAGRP